MKVAMDGSIDITATPEDGYVFSSWTVESGTGIVIDNIYSESTSVTLTGTGGTVQENFALEIYSLTMTDNGFGSTSASTTVTYGVAHSITATPYIGYDFDFWSVTSGTATIAGSL